MCPSAACAVFAPSLRYRPVCAYVRRVHWKWPCQVTDLHWCPHDGNLLATASVDGLLAFWDVRSLQRPQRRTENRQGALAMKCSQSWQHSAVLKRCRHSHRCNIRRSKVVIASLNCDSAPIGFAPSCPCNGSTGSRTHRLTPACTRACTYARAHTRAHARARTRMHARAHAIHTHECRLAGAMHFRWNLCEENCFATSHDGLVSAPVGYSAYLQISTHAFRLLLLCGPLHSCLVAHAAR